MNKKKILSLALVVLLIGTISFGTLAWFNAADEVTNTFYVADSDNDGAPDFSIDVYEQKADEDGNPVYENGNPQYTHAEGNTYKDILPGSKLSKNAYIENTGDYDQWIRVHITFSDSAVWQAAIAKAAAAEGVSFNDYVFDYLLDHLFDWNCEPNPVQSFNCFGADTMTYTFYFKEVMTPGKRIPVMSYVVIPGVLEQEDMDFDQDGVPGFTVKIKAEAVQVENLNATKASEAFAEVGWEIGTNYGE